MVYRAGLAATVAPAVLPDSPGHGPSPLPIARASYPAHSRPPGPASGRRRDVMGTTVRSIAVIGIALAMLTGSSLVSATGQVDTASTVYTRTTSCPGTGFQPVRSGAQYATN